MKLLMLGDSGVGKSCLVIRYVGEAKGKIQSMPTIGIDFKVKRILLAGRRLKLQVFDTAGQERYRTITASYYRGSNGILLVYDISARESFEAIQNWLRQIELHADANVAKVLVGNKSDLDSLREVTYSEGSDLAHDYGMKFFETSAQEDVRVDEAFETLAVEALQQRRASEHKESSVRQDSGRSQGPVPVHKASEPIHLAAAVESRQPGTQESERRCC